MSRFLPSPFRVLSAGLCWAAAAHAQFTPPPAFPPAAPTAYPAPQAPVGYPYPATDTHSATHPRSGTFPAAGTFDSPPTAVPPSLSLSPFAGQAFTGQVAPAGIATPAGADPNPAAPALPPATSASPTAPFSSPSPSDRPLPATLESPDQPAPPAAAGLWQEASPPVAGPVATDPSALSPWSASPLPYSPTEYLPDVDPVPTDRMFVQLDMLLWAVSRPGVTPIGDAASEGIVTVGGNSYFRGNSLDTGFISSDWSLGGRVDFGRVGPEGGWSSSVLFYQHEDVFDRSGAWFVPADPDNLLAGYQDSNNDSIDDDVNGNRVHGRSGQDLGTPDPNNPGGFIAPFDGTPDQGAAIDAGDLVRYLVTFDRVEATNQVDLTGFELMSVHRRGGWGLHTIDWSWGLRYLEFRDRFGVNASGGVLGTSSWNTDSDNDMLGPQVGVRWTSQRDWYRITAEGRFLAAVNFQKDRLEGSLGGGATYGGVNEPVAMEPTSFNALQTSTEFSPVGEWRVEASYYANRWLAFRLGYTGMVIGGVSRASEKIAYRLPAFALTNNGSTETIFTNGLNLGFEINR